MSVLSPSATLKAYAEWLSEKGRLPEGASPDSLSSADLYQLCDKIWGEGFDPYLLSVHVVEFIVDRLAATGAKRVFLPCISNDLLPYCLSRGPGLEALTAVVPAYSVASQDESGKSSSIGWLEGKPYEVVHEIVDTYDAVICDMRSLTSGDFLPARPLTPGYIAATSSDEEIAQEFQDEKAWREKQTAELLVATCGHLTPGSGQAVLLDTNQLFWKPKTVLGCLETSGLGLAAVVDLPANAWSIGSQRMIILSRAEPPETVFAGALSESSERNAVLQSNLASRAPGNDPGLGMLVPRREYVSLRRAAIQQKIAESFHRLALPHEPLRKLVDSGKSAWVDTPKADEGDPPNCIYLPLSPSAKVRTSRASLRFDHDDYLRTALSPGKIEAEFVAAFLNSNLGRLIRRAYTGLEARRVLGNRIVGDMPILVADLVVRTSALDADTLARNVIAEARRQQVNLWEHPQRADDARRAIRGLGSSDTLQTDWFEMLPFPLASILWEHHATGDDPARQYTVLLQFFEGLAEFWATILLSGFKVSKDPTHWNRVRAMFQDDPRQSRGGLTIATFGIWMQVVAALSRRTRSMLRDAGGQRGLCLDMFRTDNVRFLAGLSSEGLVERLHQVNQLRNEWTHGGLPSREEWIRRNAALESELVQHFRPILANTWEGARLVQAHKSLEETGADRYLQDVSLLTGTRTPFKREKVNVPETMGVGPLYLLTDDRQQPLKLLPFVKVMPGPRTARDACYFYSRRQANGIRYVSYHYDKEAEVVDVFRDTATALDEFASE